MYIHLILVLYRKPILTCVQYKNIQLQDYLLFQTRAVECTSSIKSRKKRNNLDESEISDMFWATFIMETRWTNRACYKYIRVPVTLTFRCPLKQSRSCRCEVHQPFRVFKETTDCSVKYTEGTV